jgi:hypothetical protein
MNNNELDKNKQIRDSKNDALAKESVSKGLKQVKNALNLAQCQVCLDKLSPKTKVKIKILDFDSFRTFLPLVNKYSSKFEIFKYETAFEVVSVNNQNCKDTETKSFKESFNTWLSQQKIDNKIKEILQREI